MMEDMGLLPSARERPPLEISSGLDSFIGSSTSAQMHPIRSNVDTNRQTHIVPMQDHDKMHIRTWILCALTSDTREGVEE